MDQKFLNARKRDLLIKKNRFNKEIQNIAQKRGKKYRVIFPQIGRTEDENAEEVEQYEELLNLKRNIEVDLSRIEKALKKISKGKYGQCEVCKNPIHPNRLVALPEAASCLKCQTKKTRK